MSIIMTAFDLMEQNKNEDALQLIHDNMGRCEDDPEEFTWLLNAQGYAECNLLRFDEARRTYTEFIETALSRNDHEKLHIGYHQMAMVLRMEEKYAEAMDWITKEQQIIQQHFPNDPLKKSVNLYEVGYLQFLQGNLEPAYSTMQESLALALKTDDWIAHACAYRGLGEICQGQKQIEQALEYFEKAHTLFLEADSTVGAEEVQQMMSHCKE